MKQKINKGILRTTLKRIGQLILTVVLALLLSMACYYTGSKLDEKFVLQKCLECPAKFLFILNYGFMLLCLIAFIWVVISAIRKKIAKFWIFSALMALLMVGYNSFSIFYFTYALKTFPDTMPVVLKVSPIDRQVIFYEGQIPADKRKNLTGFVLQKDNPIPIRYENGKVVKYAAGNKWYSSDDVEYSENKMNTTHKTTHEPITGFVIRVGEKSGTIIEYQNGKLGENRFVFFGENFFKENNTTWLAAWSYFKDGHILRLQEYYPNGFLKLDGDTTKNGPSWYYPNGQLLTKVSNKALRAKNPLKGVASLQKLIYNSNGQLVIYWDMRSGKALCVFPDGSSRRMTPAEIQHVFDEEDNFSYGDGGKMPEFKCE